MGVAAWLVVGSLRCWRAHAAGKLALDASFHLARTTPRAFYGLVIAHAGMGITVAGITGMSAWATENIQMMRPGETAAFRLRLRVTTVAGAGANYEAERGALTSPARPGVPSS